MIVTVAHQKGGVGKTSIAVNIAALAASQHERGGDAMSVLLLETDPSASAKIWHRIRVEQGVKPDLHLLEMSSPAAVPGVLAKLGEDYDLVVVDAGAAGYATFLRAALLSDLVLVPTPPGQFEGEQTLQLFETLDSMHARHKDGRIPAAAVLNMISTHATVGQRQIDGLRDLLASESVPGLRSVLRHRQAWLECTKEGKALHELQTRASRDAAAEMLAVFEEVAELASSGFDPAALVATPKASSDSTQLVKEAV